MLNLITTTFSGRAGVLASAALTLGLAGCTVTGQSTITSDTSCRDYFNYPADVRHDAAIKISVDVHSSDPGNPMWGLSADAACGSNPSATVGEVLGGRK